MSFAPAFRLPDRTSRTSIRRERPDRRGQWCGPAPGTGSVGCHPKAATSTSTTTSPYRGRPERRRRIQLRALSAARGTGGAGSQRFSEDEDGAIFHTYSRYARTNEYLVTAYQLLEVVPKGRDEAGLEWPMQCVRRYDGYG